MRYTVSVVNNKIVGTSGGEVQADPNAFLCHCEWTAVGAVALYGTA